MDKLLCVGYKGLPPDEGDMELFGLHTGDDSVFVEDVLPSVVEAILWRACRCGWMGGNDTPMAPMAGRPLFMICGRDGRRWSSKEPYGPGPLGGGG